LWISRSWNSHVSYSFAVSILSACHFIPKEDKEIKRIRKISSRINTFIQKRELVFYFSVLFFRELFNFYYKFLLYLKKIFYMSLPFTLKVTQKPHKRKKNWTENCWLIQQYWHKQFLTWSNFCFTILKASFLNYDDLDNFL